VNDFPASYRLASAPRCPACAGLLDGASGPRGGAPSVGDLSVCIYCSCLLCFERAADGVALRRLTDAEFTELPQDMQAKLSTVAGAAAIVREKRASGKS
jgi:hypothetical protein